MSSAAVPASHGGAGPHLTGVGRGLLGAVIPLHSGFLAGQKVRLRGRFGLSLSGELHEAAQAMVPLVWPAAAGVSGVRHGPLPRGGGRTRVARRNSARLGRHLRLNHRLGRAEKVPGGPNGQGQQQGPVQAETPSLGSGVLQLLHRRDHDPLGLIVDAHVYFDYRPGKTNKLRLARTYPPELRQTKGAVCCPAATHKLVDVTNATSQAPPIRFSLSTAVAAADDDVTAHAGLFIVSVAC